MYMKRPGGPWQSMLVATDKAHFYLGAMRWTRWKRSRELRESEGASCKVAVEWKLRHAAKMWGGSTLHQYRAGEDAMPFSSWSLVGSLGIMGAVTAEQSRSTMGGRVV